MTIVVAIVVGAVAFYGGMTYQKSQAPQPGSQAQNGGPGGRSQGRNGGNGQRPIAGEIISADDKSITIKLQDGSTKIVLLTDKTTINKAAEATKSELTTGQRVAAFGMENADGSITASNIQLNPMMFRNSGASPSPTSK